MKMKMIVMSVCAVSCTGLFAQARDTFIQQQAFAEMQRVSGQVDVLQANLSDVQRRVGKLEGSGEAGNLKQEINALKASLADLRREMQAMRGEIVKDLSSRIAKMQTPAPAPVRPADKKVVVGPHVEYTVSKGDTLSLIAEAFNTTVPKIREMNNLKNDNLRVGQKLNLPK